MSETDNVPRGSKFTCNTCGESFDDQDKLNSHISILHSEKESSLDIRTQYERIAEDWRTTIWARFKR